MKITEIDFNQLSADIQNIRKDVPCRFIQSFIDDVARSIGVKISHNDKRDIMNFIYLNKPLTDESCQIVAEVILCLSQSGTINIDNKLGIVWISA